MISLHLPALCGVLQLPHIARGCLWPGHTVTSVLLSGFQMWFWSLCVAAVCNSHQQLASLVVQMLFHASSCRCVSSLKQLKHFHWPSCSDWVLCRPQLWSWVQLGLIDPPENRAVVKMQGSRIVKFLPWLLCVEWDELLQLTGSFHSLCSWCSGWVEEKFLVMTRLQSVLTSSLKTSFLVIHRWLFCLWGKSVIPLPPAQFKLCCRAFSCGICSSVSVPLLERMEELESEPEIWFSVGERKTEHSHPHLARNPSCHWAICRPPHVS